MGADSVATLIVSYYEIERPLVAVHVEIYPPEERFSPEPRKLPLRIPTGILLEFPYEFLPLLIGTIRFEEIETPAVTDRMCRRTVLS